MFNKEDIQNLAQIMQEQQLSKIKIEDERGKIELESATHQNVSTTPVVPTLNVATNTPADTSTTNDNTAGKVQELFEVTSPMIGTAYAAPDPSSPNFVEVGSKVKADTVICLLEAMKLYTEVEAGVDGQIVEILFKDGDFIEYGQPLFRIKY